MSAYPVFVVCPTTLVADGQAVFVLRLVASVGAVFDMFRFLQHASITLPTPSPRWLSKLAV